MVAENVFAEHYATDFDMIFHFKQVQSLVAEHYVRDFDIIFHFKAVQNLVDEHYEIDFEIIFHFNLKRLKTWLWSTMKEILTFFFTLSGSTLDCRALLK